MSTPLKRILLLIAGFMVLLALSLLLFRWQAQMRETQTYLTAAPATGRFVQAGDVALFVQEMGNVTDPKVLLIHGTGAWSEIWRAPMAALAAVGFHAIAVDLPPFGFSQRPVTGDYSRQAQAQRIVALLDALQIEPVILVGHSVGGGPTIEAALFRPERVRALVLVDAALNLQAPKGVQSAPSPLSRGFFALRPLRNAVLASTITNPLFTKKLLQLLIHDPAAATPAYVQMLQQPLTLVDTTDALGDWLFSFLTMPVTGLSSEPTAYHTLTMPTLLLWGERDTITPLSQGAYLQEILPNAELVVLPDVGHIPHIEDTAAFTATVVRFLGTHGGKLARE